MCPQLRGIYFSFFFFLPLYRPRAGKVQYACDVVVVIWISTHFCYSYNTPKKQVRNSSSTRPPAVSLWRHVPPTQQPFSVLCPRRITGAVPNSASGGRCTLRWPPGDGSLAPRDGQNRKKMENTARYLYQRMCCCTFSSARHRNKLCTNACSAV